MPNKELFVEAQLSTDGTWSNPYIHISIYMRVLYISPPYGFNEWCVGALGFIVYFHGKELSITWDFA